MTVTNIASSVFSNLFRIAVFIFLRIVGSEYQLHRASSPQPTSQIPTTLAKPVLPTLFTLYLCTSWLSTEKYAPDTSHKTAHKSVSVKPVPATARHEEPVLNILFSLPTKSRRLKLANLIINVFLLLAVVEFLAYPFIDSASDVVFTRVGAVYHDRIKIAVRYPLTNHSDEELPYIVWREANNNSSWVHGPSLHLSEDNDWVQTVQLTGLWPSASYEYRLSSNGSFLPYPSEPISFRTFPDPHITTGSRFRFLVSSCITPNFPYVPMHGRRIRGFDLLADYLFKDEETVSQENHTAFNVSSTPALSPVEFMLFLGDFIYADVPLYIGNDPEAYRRLYRRNYQSPSFRKIYEKLPILHAYDDHEIINNFAGQGNDSIPPFINATNPFTIYNSNANYDSPISGQYYFDFRYGDTAFFVMDTRRYRTAILENPESPRTMLGELQLDALQTWLAKVNNTATFKFIVSSVPFTSLWGHDAQIDSWAGYADEKATLLDMMHAIPNVYVLSGDRHEFAAIEFTGRTVGEHPVREFSTSPLSMFYIPFVRTLNMKSQETVLRNVWMNSSEVDGEPSLRTEEIPKERVLKYIASGNHKWSAIEIDTTDPDKPSLKLEMLADGVLKYKLDIAGTPVKLQSSTALGALVPAGIKEMLSKFGMKPSRWF
ncbi:hypothetical protein HGRIS_013360 [Hohenbuehelia grisea]|uniref:PhoD-like phosphatase metallophosphatase domain-containing protein n=1 Tax=Hohenbuehelia grisea TaxID=104357 RepID=A0ABR3IV70_9AGAR